jgi:hypothetical protein
MMQLPTRALILAGLAVFVTACSDSASTGEPADPGNPVAPQSSFGQLQRHLFARQCAECHKPGGIGEQETGLVLDNAEKAYVNLIGVIPRNASARQDGLYRVMPRDPERSLLWHKLQWNTDHHSGRSYGSPMPLGGESPSIGQLDFVRAWINAGAPYEGFVADSALLFDTRKPFVEPFKPLTLPTRGYQIRIDSFDVKPNSEREVLVYRRVGNTTDEYVNRIESRVRINSHHLLVMAFKDSTPARIIPPFNTVRDVRDDTGGLIYANMLVMEWHSFFAGSGTIYEDRKLPAGVALKLPANAALDMNSHYVNRTTRAIPGEVHVNLHTVPASEVQKEARSFTVQNDTFALPPRTRTTLVTTHRFTQTTNLLMLTSHNHELGESFTIEIVGGPRDGEVIYRSTDWRSPTVAWFDQPIVFQAGQGIRSRVTYNNTTDRVIRHGPTANDEMNIIRGYWY